MSAIGRTILAATVVLMHFVLQMDTEVRQRTHAVATVGRLAEQFRRDVHQARGEPVVAADHRAAELHLPGGTIVKWRIDEPERIDSHRNRPRRSPTARNSFTPAQGTTAALELQPQGAARIVTLRIDSPGTGGPSLAIEALASRDERLAAEEEKP